MSKLLAIMLLAIVSRSAIAEEGVNANWSYADVSEDAMFYVDKSTIRKTGDMVKMWVLLNFNNKLKHGKTSGRSSMSQDEFDCKEEQMRERYSARYSGDMGGGDVISSISTPSGWQPVGPGSVGKTLWNIACGNP